MADDIFQPGHVASDELFAAGHVGEEPSQLESGLRGVAQGASLGFADEATGAAEALMDKLKGAHEALGELYLKHRDESRKAYHAAQEANPLTYGAGELGGSLATGLVPGLGAGGLARTAAVGAGLGAAAGLGNSEAATARDLVQDTAVSGLVGGAAGAAGHVLGTALGVGANAAEPALQRQADFATVKTGGMMGKAAKALAKSDPEALASRAQLMRDEGLVTPLSTVQDVAERAQAKMEQGTQSYRNSLQGLDEKVANDPALSNMSGNSIADVLEREVKAPLLQNPNRSPQAEGHLSGLIDRYRELGDTPMTFDAADRLLQGAQGSAKSGFAAMLDEATHPGVQQVKMDAARAMRRELLKQANYVDPAQAAIRDQAGLEMSRLNPILSTAQGRAAELGTQSQLGMLGGLGAVAGIASGHGVVGVAGALGQKAIRQYGNSLAATGFQKLAQVARTNPQALGKWGGYLAAAAARGDSALAVAHYALSQNDSEYGSLARAALDAEQ